MKYIFRKRRWHFIAGAVDTIGRVLAGFPSGLAPFPKNSRSLLVVRLDHIGDIVRATAIPQLIKEAYPQTKLIFLTNASGAQIIDGNPYVDEVVVFDPAWYAIGTHSHSRSGTTFRQVVKDLKARQIDAALLPRGDIRENALAKSAGISYRAGYGVTGGGFLLSRVVRYRFDAHEDEHTMDVLRAAGIEVKTLRPRIYLSTRTPQDPSALFSRLSMDPALPWTGVLMEAGTTAKEWGAQLNGEFLKQCAAALLKHHLYFVGQNKEQAVFLDAFLAQNKHLGWLNLIGKTSLEDMKQLLLKTGAFVGFDSGLTHMAAAMGLPTLFIYSGTNNFENWKPLAEYTTVFQNKVDCSPCHLAECSVSGHPCMSGVSPSRVVNWIKERV